MLATRCIFAALIMLAIVRTNAADGGNWIVEQRMDASSYQMVSTLWQESAAAISDEYGAKQVQPRLELRCDAGGDGRISARIDWRRFISSFNVEVAFTTDDDNTLTLTMGVDRSNKVTSTKRADDDLALLEFLDDSESVSVAVTPYSEAPVSVEFDLGGLHDGVQRLQASCRD